MVYLIERKVIFLETSTHISIVLPCFNEGRNIYKNIGIIHDFVADRFLSFEIVAVDDGSRDRTLSELRRAEKDFCIRVIHRRRNKGKGSAVRDGVLASTGEIIVFLDADLAIPIEGIEKFLFAIENGCDIAIASRFVSGNRVEVPVKYHRRFMEIVFRFLRILIIGGWSVKDTQCGFKVFSRKAALDIFPLLTVNRFAFDAEIIFIALRRGYRINELPITLRNPIRTSVRIVRDSTSMLFDLFKIRWNGISGRYDD